MGLDARTVIQVALAQGITRDDLLAELQSEGPVSGPEVPGDALDGEGVELPDRYEDLGPLGSGGMGEVRRVRDHKLGRTLAMKCLFPHTNLRPELRERFLTEARLTAQLQHPGIVPVHDMGTLRDGRIWFTMQEVVGRTLGDVIREVHALSRIRWEVTPSGWSLRRLVDALRRVCEAVSYAHMRGIIHRDLKPTNVMVGAHGEILVMDWGIARVLGAPQAGSSWSTRQQDSVELDEAAGGVTGTPAFMSPEQALGRNAEVDERSDVYSLGALLYTVLAGHPPYEGETSEQVMALVRTGPPRSLEARVASESTFHFSMVEPAEPVAEAESRARLLPSPLVAICHRAMSRERSQRYPSAERLARELGAWLDGEKRREEALEAVASAQSTTPEVRALRLLSASLRTEAEEILSAIESWRPETDKAAAWAKEDKAGELEGLAVMKDIESEGLLRAALTRAADLPEAHIALAMRFKALHMSLEDARKDTRRVETLLRQHVNALPEAHPERAGLEAYLTGTGALTLVTDPPGAEVILYRYRRHNRRLVPERERSLGLTPLKAVPLPMGSYLCTIHHEGRVPLRYPVHIGRCEHWDGVPHGDHEPTPVRLPRISTVAPTDCVVPAGWFWVGGDDDARDSLPRRRVWIDAWVFEPFQVTNRRYFAFLNDLIAQGRREEALQHAPRSLGAKDASMLLAALEGDHFTLPLLSKAGSARWDPDWPVMMVDHAGASAFARWQAERSGRPWQLPPELVWEKAARGVDGRSFPWGDAFDPSWASMKDSHAGTPMPGVVSAFPIDESVYGVRGMGGNIKDWCAEEWQVDGPALDAGGVWVETASAEPGPEVLRVRRGGGWDSAVDTVRCAMRDARKSEVRAFDLGFRLAHPLS